MKFILTLICSFFLIAAPTVEQVRFEETINKNYEKYYYVVEEETTVGDIIIVVGSINKQMYVSGFIYNTTKTKHVFSIDNNIYENHFYKIKKDGLLEVFVKTNEGTIFKRYEIKVPAEEELNNMDVIVGEGKNNFPKEKIKVDIIDIFISLSFGFIGIIALFTVVLTMLYRRKMGRFNTNYPKDTSWENYEYHPEEEVIDVYEENYQVVEKTKEEQMKEAYDDYNSGKITESELNNRLRSIWWSNEDD
ncbi:MAG: hypothetical protein IJX78_04140 [Bacilli bacterium]|nr:hypothetical protein [Bacilli bacterium]